MHAESERDKVQQETCRGFISAEKLTGQSVLKVALALVSRSWFFFEFFLRKADVEPEESSTVPGVCCVRLGQNRCAGVTGLTITESSPFEFGRLSWCDKLPCQQALWLTCRRALPAPLKASGSVVVSWSLGFRSVCGPVCLSESLPLFVPSSISCRFCNSSLSLSPSLPLSLFSFPDFAFVCVYVFVCSLCLSHSRSVSLSIPLSSRLSLPAAIAFHVHDAHGQEDATVPEKCICNSENVKLL